MLGRNKWSAIGGAAAIILLATIVVLRALQAPTVRSIDENVLREYTGAYQWDSDSFVYLQMWNEFAGANQLIAFDESGEVRTLYPTDPDRFFAGPGAAVASAIESRIAFQRDDTGKITSMSWERTGIADPRTARRVNLEKHEDVRFLNGDIQLAGTLISPNTAGAHPAIVLVHGSGPANR
jgi:hypothetical protein